MDQSMEQYLDASREELKELIRQLCAIPAPSHREQRRAAFCRDWFEKNGGRGVFIDQAQNVICPYGDTEGPLTVFMAHTDTVFPDMEPMPFFEDGETFRCPGVGDDTANLAILMICARYFLRKQVPCDGGILFVANSCEEGLGNLKGSRGIAAAYGGQIRQWISFDGSRLDRITQKAVGSHRYEVTVRTEGGHSFGAFGNRNALAVLSSLIASLYTVKVPQVGDSKTTYNVGRVWGGTSVNTIAQEAAMLWEYRSDDRKCLEKMQEMFEKFLEAYRASGVEIQAELVGDRPCAGQLDPARQEALEDMARQSIRLATGKEPTLASGSTDCNIPLSLGIPAVCLGLVESTGTHTRQETLYLESLGPGSRLCMDFLSKFFRVGE